MPESLIHRIFLAPGISLRVVAIQYVRLGQSNWEIILWVRADLFVFLILAERQNATFHGRNLLEVNKE